MTPITLKKPIVRGETEITEIDIREPKAGELRGIRLNDLLNGDVDAITTVLPRITSPVLQKHEIDALNPVDLANCCGEIMGFFMDAG